MSTLSTFFQGSRTMRYLLAALILLMVADGLITKFLVGSGLGHEGNIFLRSVVGQDVFIVLKAGGAIVCAFLLWDMHRRWYKLAFISTICFVTVYCGIVVWNLYVFFATGGIGSLFL